MIWCNVRRIVWRPNQNGSVFLGMAQQIVWHNVWRIIWCCEINILTRKDCAVASAVQSCPSLSRSDVVYCFPSMESWNMRRSMSSARDSMLWQPAPYTCSVLCGQVLFRSCIVIGPVALGQAAAFFIVHRLESSTNSPRFVPWQLEVTRFDIGLAQWFGAMCKEPCSLTLQ